MEAKTILRKEMKNKLAGLGHLYDEWSKNISGNLFSHSDWQCASTVALTISRRPEVDTYPIIERAWQEGKKVAVPKCLPKEKQLDFRLLDNFNQLEVVYYGLKEPKQDETETVSPAAIDLVIVPGLIYEPRGYRIGFGGGYYDRFLESYNGKTIALAFSLQVADKLPVEPFDIPVQSIITEEKVIRCHD